MQSTVAALGRIGQLGDFYDMRTDSFISGANLFSTASELRPLINTIENCHTDLQYVLGDSLEDKCNHLDVSAELKLSVLGGLFELSGSGKYLNDRKKTSRVCSCTLIYNIKTKADKLNNIFDEKLKSLICLDALNAVGEAGTHVVTEVQYGANAMATFENRLEDASDVTKVEGMLSGELGKIALSISGKGQVDYKTLDAKKFQHLSFKVFGDILSDDDVPQSIEQAIVYMKDVPSKLRAANEGRGVPLRYGLFPIPVLKMYLQMNLVQQQVIKSIGEATIQSFVHLFEDIAKQKQELRHWSELIREFEFVIPYDDKTRITGLLRDLELFDAATWRIMG